MTRRGDSKAKSRAPGAPKRVARASERQKQTIGVESEGPRSAHEQTEALFDELHDLKERWCSAARATGEHRLVLLAPLLWVVDTARWNDLVLQLGPLDAEARRFLRQHARGRTTAVAAGLPEVPWFPEWTPESIATGLMLVFTNTVAETFTAGEKNGSQLAPLDKYEEVARRLLRYVELCVPRCSASKEQLAAVASGLRRARPMEAHLAALTVIRVLGGSSEDVEKLRERLRKEDEQATLDASNDELAAYMAKHEAGLRAFGGEVFRQVVAFADARDMVTAQPAKIAAYFVRNRFCVSRTFASRRDRVLVKRIEWRLRREITAALSSARPKTTEALVRTVYAAAGISERTIDDCFRAAFDPEAHLRVMEERRAQSQASRKQDP